MTWALPRDWEDETGESDGTGTRDTTTPRKRVCTYPYHDAAGNFLAGHIRWEPKTFTWTPEGIKSGELPLYGLPAVLDAISAGAVIWLCEGEKDADAVTALGECGTTGPVSSSWGDHLTEALRGARVHVIRDRDENGKGYEYAALRVAALRDAAAEIRVFDPLEGKDVSDHLAAGYALDELVEIEPGKAVEDAVERAITKETLRQSIIREAKRRVDYAEAEAQMKLPPERADYTLASWREDDKSAPVARIESLQLEGQNATLIAAYKVGKTTLAANLVASLTDGTPFLDTFPVQPPDGRIAIWNAEMNAAQLEAYLSQANVTKADRVAIWNLRGFRVPLLSDAGRDVAIRWLRSNEVAYWILDPWTRVCSWCGVSDNKNEEVMPLLQRIQEIADEAGVGEFLVVHHEGWTAGRPRGATDFPGFFDALWHYERGDEDDRDSRYLRAEGREVGIDAGLVTLTNGVTGYEAISRKEVKWRKQIRLALEYVREHEGCKRQDVYDQLTISNGQHASVIDRAIERGLLVDAPKDRRSSALHITVTGEAELTTSPGPAI